MIKKAFKAGFNMVSSIIKKMSKISIIATSVSLVAAGFGIFKLIKRRKENGKIENN